MAGIFQRNLATGVAEAIRVRHLVTDNRMPGTMNGVKLVKVVRERWPWIKLAVAALLIDEEAALPRGCRYFAKPYKIADIVEHLQKGG